MSVKDREGTIGSSDAAAILGLSPWKTPLDVWEETTGRAQPQEQSEAMRFGNLLEGIVCDEYARREQVAIVESDEVRHPVYDFIRVHPDRLVVRPEKVVEAKTAGVRQREKWGDEGTDEIPDFYLAQCVLLMACTDRDACDVPVLFGGQDFRIYRVGRAKQVENEVLKQILRFWEQHVEKDKPPEPTTGDEVQRIWPQSHAGTLVATEDLLWRVERLHDLRDEIKTLEDTKARLEFELKRALQEKDTLVSPADDPLLTWKTQKHKRFDQKAFREAHPELYEQFKREGTFRVLRLKGGSK